MQYIIHFIFTYLLYFYHRFLLLYMANLTKNEKKQQFFFIWIHIIHQLFYIYIQILSNTSCSLIIICITAHFLGNPKSITKTQWLQSLRLCFMATNFWIQFVFGWPKVIDLIRIWGMLNQKYLDIWRATATLFFRHFFQRRGKSWLLLVS